MHKKILLSLIVCLMIVSSSLLAACSEKTTPTSEPTATPTDATTAPSAAATTWWENKWGEPQYGGTLTFRKVQIDDTFFDACNPQGIEFQFWQESLFGNNMTTDRNEFSFSIDATPTKYRAGWLAESWEQTDPTTVTVHLRQGVHWQDKAPVNGREFTAHDVEYTWDRIMGTGSGFTEPFMFFPPVVTAIQKVTAVDDYTLEFKINQLYELAIYEVMGPTLGFGVVAHEWVELGEEGQNDWQNAVGTGPFIITELDRGTSITFTKNPDYWGYDSRYPDNKLPYVDELKILAIPDISTALAALRTGRVDIMAHGQSYLSLAQAESLSNTDPDIQLSWWSCPPVGVCYKYNTAPFNDIRVRKALQLAVNVPEVARSHYNGTVEGVTLGLASPLLGEDWVVPYDQWPAELQAEYSYDPEKAKELLAEAAADGVFEPNELGGFDTNVIASNTVDLELLQIIQSYFKQVGVDMDVSVSDNITHFNLVMQRKYDQMSMCDLSGVTTFPSDAILQFLPTSMKNIAGVDDPTYNEMAQQFRQASSLEEAQQLFQEADRYFLQQHWILSMCATSSPQARQSWLKGYCGELLGNVWGLEYFHYMWIDQSMKE